MNENHVAWKLNQLQGREAGGHILIIGGGPSAKRWSEMPVGYMRTLAINGAFQLCQPDYAMYLDYDEPRSPWVDDLYALPTRATIFPNALRELYPDATHAKLSEDEPDIRSASLGLYSPLRREGTPGTRRPGTTALQALHLAGILGASKVSMIGVDLSFPNGPDGEHHAYPCRKYGEYVTMSGDEMMPRKHRFDYEDGDYDIVDTCEWFLESARVLTEYREVCRAQGMGITDYSGGLLAAMGW